MFALCACGGPEGAEEKAQETIDPTTPGGLSVTSVGLSASPLENLPQSSPASPMGSSPVNMLGGGSPAVDRCSTDGGDSMVAHAGLSALAGGRSTRSELEADDRLQRVPEEARAVLQEATRLRLSESKPFAAEAEVFKLVKRLEAEGKSDLLAQVQKTKAYCELVEEMQLINDDLQTLLDDKGWTVQKEAQGVHVWTRQEPGVDAVTVRIAGVHEGPFAEYCAIGKEVPLYGEWMWGMKECKLLAENGPFEFISYYATKFPFISAREFLLQEWTFVNDEEAYCTNRRLPPVPREDFEFEVPETQKGHIRCAIETSIGMSVPLGKFSDGKDYIFVIILMNLDMKMPLPRRLTNMLSVKVGFDSFIQTKALLKKAQEKTSPWRLSVEDPKNKLYYERLSALEKARESRPISCIQEIVETGWVTDPAERRKMFARSENVLVPMR